jgi:DNA invertase Pin-like site-specific DNA recombinase
MEVTAHYIDRAKSGLSANNRAEFCQMIQDSEGGGFDAVLVYQLDRFARCRYDSAVYKNQLKTNGVKVISSRENISEDASGILMESVLEGMAEYYSHELSQKVLRGLYMNAERALYTGAGVPVGYKIAERKFEIDAQSAPTVKRVFEMYLDGARIADIVRAVGKPKSGVRRMLTNRRYTGCFIYGRICIPNAIPRIISDEDFEKVQTRLGKVAVP